MKDMETISLIKNDKQTIKNNDYHVSCYPIWKIVIGSLGLAIILLIIVSYIEKNILL